MRVARRILCCNGSSDWTGVMRHILLSLHQGTFKNAVQVIQARILGFRVAVAMVLLGLWVSCPTLSRSSSREDGIWTAQVSSIITMEHICAVLDP